MPKAKPSPTKQLPGIVLRRAVEGILRRHPGWTGDEVVTELLRNGHTGADAQMVRDIRRDMDEWAWLEKRATRFPLPGGQTLPTDEAQTHPEPVRPLLDVRTALLPEVSVTRRTRLGAGVHEAIATSLRSDPATTNVSIAAEHQVSPETVRQIRKRLGVSSVERRWTRRDVTIADRRAIEGALRGDPERTDRSIAAEFDVDHRTVAEVRHTMSRWRWLEPPGFGQNSGQRPRPG